MIPADDFAAAGLLCAHCRGELGYFIEEGRIIVEVCEDDADGLDEEEIWDALREYLPEDLCGMMEDAGFSPEIVWNTLKEKGWFEP